MNKTYPYIGFFRRAAALLVDFLILWIFFSLVYFVLQFISQTIAAGWIWMGLPVYWLYFAWQESSPRQATLGKRLLRIKVIGKDGNRITFARATGRTFARILSNQTINIGFVMAGCTSRNRALHDFIAETYVVRADFQPGSELPDTPQHTGWIIAWGILLALITIALMVLSFVLQYYAMPIQAAGRLQELAATQEEFANPLEENGNKYYRHVDGYRVLLDDENQNTLFLPHGAEMPCCEDNAKHTCQLETGFSPCVD